MLKFFKGVIVTALVVALILSCQDKQASEQEVEQEKTNSTDTAVQEPESDDKIILFFGNSLTAGYGLDQDQSFPALIQKRLDSLGLFLP